MKKILILSVIASGSYFVLVTSFFNGPLKANLIDDIPDLLTLTAGLAFFLLSWRIRSRARPYMRIGAMLIVVGKVIEIVLQEYLITDVVIPPLYWLLLSVNNFFGILLLLFSFNIMYDK